MISIATRLISRALPRNISHFVQSGVAGAGDGGGGDGAGGGGGSAPGGGDSVMKAPTALQAL